MFIHFNDEYNAIYGMYNYIQLLKGSSQLSTLSVKMSPYCHVLAWTAGAHFTQGGTQ